MLRNATQDNRQLAVFTPFGDERLLLQSFEGQEGLSEISRFQLEMISAEPDLDPRQILGENVTFTAKLLDGEARYFNGYVSEFCQVEVTDRMYVYRAEVVSWLWFLTLASDCRIFQEMKTPDIIQQVFDRSGFTDYDLSQLQGDYVEHEYCVQYRESHFDFVSRLMEEEGIFYYFKHENGKHKLILADSMGSYFPLENDEVHMAPRAEHGLQNMGLTDWCSGKQVLASRCVSTDYNFATPHSRLDSSSKSNIQALSNLGLEHFEYPGRFYQGGDGLARVNVRIEEEEAKHEWVSAKGVRDSFTPGGLFKVQSHPDHNQVGRQMVLRKCSYYAGEVGSYTTQRTNESEHPWSVDFEALPATTVFRAERRAPTPVVEGPQTAVVVGPRGEEIHTDKHGRIKVQFHWDREGSKDEKSSCWVRVSQVHAGAGWGMMSVPRIGEEVIVSFLEGDPDKPIVKGRVYNGAVQPPFGLPGQMTRSGGKSNTHKGSGYNEVTADDTAGKEQLRSNAQFNMDTTVGNSQTLQVGNDRTEDIGNNDTLKVGVDKSVEVGNNMTEVAGNNENIIAGNNIELKAGVALTLKCGQSTIHMNQAGVITISGQYVSSLARACNSIVAPMTEIAGSRYLNQGGLICLDVGGIKKINGGETTVSAATVDVSGGTVVVKGAPIEIGVPGMKPASIPAPGSGSGGGGGAGPASPASTGSGGSSGSQGGSGDQSDQSQDGYQDIGEKGQAKEAKPYTKETFEADKKRAKEMIDNSRAELERAKTHSSPELDKMWGLDPNSPDYEDQLDMRIRNYDAIEKELDGLDYELHSKDKSDGTLATVRPFMNRAFPSYESGDDANGKGDGSGHSRTDVKPEGVMSDTVDIYPKFTHLDPDQRAATLIHETSHTTGMEPDRSWLPGQTGNAVDYGYVVRDQNGNFVGYDPNPEGPRPRNAIPLNADQTVVNADTYGEFAADAAERGTVNVASTVTDAPPNDWKDRYIPFNGDDYHTFVVPPGHTYDSSPGAVAVARPDGSVELRYRVGFTQRNFGEDPQVFSRPIRPQK